MKQKIKGIQHKQGMIGLQGNMRESNRHTKSSGGLFSMVADAYAVERDNPILVEVVDLSHLQMA